MSQSIDTHDLLSLTVLSSSHVRRRPHALQKRGVLIGEGPAEEVFNASWLVASASPGANQGYLKNRRDMCGGAYLWYLESRSG